MGYVIGVDIGTSSTKAVLFDTQGTQVAQAAQSYPLHAPVPGAAEQSANDILQATLQTVAEVMSASGIARSELLGIAFSAAMHTLLLVDEANAPITPMYTWADNRSDRWAKKVASQIPDLYARTGIPPHPMSPVVKLAWLCDEQPQVFVRAARVVAIKEYVLHHWCGEWVIDQSMASTTGLLNVRSLDWDEAVLAAAGIDRQQLSVLVPTTHQLAVNPGPAAKMGIAEGTPVIVGASDGVLANLGVGAIDSTTAAITLGTSGAVRRVVAKSMVDRLGDIPAQLFCYALTEDVWVMGGAVNNGGIALQWVRDRLVPFSADDEDNRCEPIRSTYARLTEMASAIAPGAEGLIFHPHLLGERAPLWDGQARASFFGLGRYHTQRHLVRAVMEGVLYNLQMVFSALEAAGGEVSVLRAAGGFAQSDLWQQMLADIFDRTVLVPQVIESSALGAAVLALVALGEWDELSQVQTHVAIAQTRHPIAQNVRRYQKLLPIYGELLAGFQEQYAALQAAIS
ncbi:MAG: FGGY family carbohydrate kinase [Cyanobacteria bacterium J06598_3]